MPKTLLGPLRWILQLFTTVIQLTALKVHNIWRSVSSKVRGRVKPNSRQHSVPKESVAPYFKVSLGSRQVGRRAAYPLAPSSEICISRDPISRDPISLGGRLWALRLLPPNSYLERATDCTEHREHAIVPPGGRWAGSKAESPWSKPELQANAGNDGA